MDQVAVFELVTPFDLEDDCHMASGESAKEKGKGLDYSHHVLNLPWSSDKKSRPTL